MAPCGWSGVVWCGVVRCGDVCGIIGGAVLCGVMWCDVVQCGWSGAVR